MKLKPLADRVVLKQRAAEERTASGLFLASSAQEKPEIYDVIEVGPGGLVDGNQVEMIVKAGQQVLVGKYSGSKVKLEDVESEETTKSGIILTAAAKEKPQMAEVLAVGPGGNVDGKEIVMSVEVGQKVIYSKYAGTEVKLDGEEFIIVRQGDILAVVE